MVMLRDIVDLMRLPILGPELFDIDRLDACVSAECGSYHAANDSTYVFASGVFRTVEMMPCSAPGSYDVAYCLNSRSYASHDTTRASQGLGMGSQRKQWCSQAGQALGSGQAVVNFGTTLVDGTLHGPWTRL